MKKKFSKILGVALTVALVASLFVFAIPVAAQPGNMRWDAQLLPTITGNVMAFNTNVVDIAVANDGTTIYAVNNLNAAGAALLMTVASVAPNFHVYKSTNAGQSWTGISLDGVTGAVAAAMGNIAVAPDNPDYVAVSTRDATTPGGITDTVYISSNGGITWSALPALQTPTAVGNQGIQDLAVGPARSGTLLGREYLVAVADDAVGIADGDVQIIGETAAWTSVDAVNVDGAADYMACAFSPGFVGDRTIVAVGADTAVVGSVLHIINTASATQIHAWVVLDATVDDFNAAANGILAADIALPIDFVPDTADERSYASTASATAGDSGVWRVDEDVSRELGLLGTTYTSVAYNGTVDEGILFVGQYAARTVRWTDSPTVTSPTWKSSRKAPTGAVAAARTLLRVAADYATTSRVFAGTQGAESAFSVSNNAAVSFDQESLIDSIAANTVVKIDSIALTPDGGTIFVATDDAAELSLWKSTTPVSATSWSRIYCTDEVAAVLGNGMVGLNPDWDTDPVLYFLDTNAAGALAGVNNVFVSTDGGDTFSTRSSPVGGVAVAAVAVESALVIHVAQATNVYKSINAGWTYDPAVPALAGTIISLAVPVADHLLVGGTAAVSYSTDGAATFTDIAGIGGVTYAVCADEDYATNNTFYAGDTSATNDLIYRFVIGTDTSLVSLANVAAAGLMGVAMNNGTLYGMAGASASRSLYPDAAVGNLGWETMSIGAPAAVANFGAVDNVLYAANAVVTLWAYDDFLATAVPILTGPADGVAVSVDPVSGRADMITLTWDAMGSGVGLVDNYDINITKVSDTSWAAALSDPSRAVGDATIPRLTVHAVLGIWTQALAANTEYMWRVRAEDMITIDNISSRWSESRTFSVQAGGVVVAPQVGPVLQGPTGGATDVSLNPGFSWTPISGATEYEFILALDATLTDTVEDTPVYVNQPSWQVPAGTLVPDTQYFWGVKSTLPTESPQSIGTFRTIAPDVYTCPICAETFTTAGALDSHIIAIHPAATPAYIWAIIVIGAVLMIAVVMLIVRTRRVV